MTTRFSRLNFFNASHVNQISINSTHQSQKSFHNNGNYNNNNNSNNNNFGHTINVNNRSRAHSNVSSVVGSPISVTTNNMRNNNNNNNNGNNDDDQAFRGHYTWNSASLNSLSGQVCF